MPSMDTVQWAREQRAIIKSQVTALEAEIRRLNKVDESLVKLLPDTTTAQPSGKPRKSAKRSVKHAPGAVTPQVLKALETGPMTIQELTETLGRRVPTGVSSVVRFQTRAGTIVAVGNDKYALSSNTNGSGVLVG
jgi:hypothetical protein